MTRAFIVTNPQLARPTPAGPCIETFSPDAFWPRENLCPSLSRAFPVPAIPASPPAGQPGNVVPLQSRRRRTNGGRAAKACSKPKKKKKSKWDWPRVSRRRLHRPQRPLQSRCPVIDGHLDALPSPEKCFPDEVGKHSRPNFEVTPELGRIAHRGLKNPVPSVLDEENRPSPPPPPTGQPPATAWPRL